MTETTSGNPRLCDNHNHLRIVSGTRFDEPNRCGKVVVIVPRRYFVGARRPDFQLRMAAVFANDGSGEICYN